MAPLALALDDEYHDMQETYDALVAAVTNYPEICRMDTVGYSTEDGLPIWSLKMSDNVDVDEDEPVVYYNGVHHADEVLGLEVCLYMIDELTAAYGVDPTMTSWIDDIEIWFTPLLNPEGHAIVTAEIDTIWRKNKRDNNESGDWDYEDGVDLNRNYDFNWNQGGSDIWESEYYRGPYPFSENESQIVRDFCLEHKPVFALNYHSPRSSQGDLLYYPWYWVGQGFSTDHFTIYDIASEVCARTFNEAGQNFIAYYGYADKGNAKNWQYGVVGTIGLTMEILSQQCQPVGSRVDTICQLVSEGSYYLLERAYGPGITGHVTDAVTRQPIVAEVNVVENYSELVTPRTTEPTYGRYWRQLIPGTYTVEFSAFGYDTQTFEGVVVESVAAYTVLDCEMSAWTGAPDDVIEEPRIVDVSPNPSSGLTSVSFVAPPGAPIAVEIYSVAGRLVATADAEVDGATGQALWDGMGSDGRPVASGVYFARLVGRDPVDQAKIVLVR
jgi:hypothetical protein